MRAAQTRVTGLLMLAVGATTALAVYWLPRVAHDAPLSAYHAPTLVASSVVVALLAAIALHRDSAKHTRRAFEQLKQCALSETPCAGDLINERSGGEVARELREHIDAQKKKIDNLLMQKKNLEIQLKIADAQRKQTQVMIHGISDAVIITDAFDETLIANPAAGDLFAFDANKAARQPVAKLLTGSALAGHITEMRQHHARTNRRTFEFEHEINKQVRHFSVTMTCVNDSADQFGGVVTVLHDITREKEVGKMKNEFVSHVSHELRTPLSSIKAYAELLVDGEASDEKTRQEFYHVIQTEANRLGRLIDNILNISRIEAGMTKVNKKPVDVSSVVKQVLEVAMPTAKEKQIQLVDQLKPVFDHVNADRDMIYQACLNLVSNAIKYTPSGGTVKVSLDVDEAARQVKVLVTDTGVGIPADAMKHLFEKFFRVEQNKSMAKGSGLGLNLTRQIVESVHEGKMLVQSEVGKGSTFGFTLPLAA